jgi:hypothetical protein
MKQAMHRIMVVSDSEQKRCDECPHRLPHQCSRVSATIGMEVNTPLPACDACWTQGPETEEAKVYRDQYAATMIAYLLRVENFKRLPPSMQKVMLEKHSTPEAAAALNSHPEVEMSRKRPDRWTRAKPSWEMAESFIKSLASRGFTGRKVELTVKGRRHISCFGTDLEGTQVQPPCPALASSKDGKHHYCNDCGCGDQPLALLDGDGYQKLDYPYLLCPRERDGFSSQSLGIFDRIICVNLDRRRDRWEAFLRRTRETIWPFGTPDRFSAIDGHLLPAPDRWPSGAGAWGCLQSHKSVLERAMLDGIYTILVFEDDAAFTSDFAGELEAFLRDVPSDWEGLMLGGQHMESPLPVSPTVVRCRNTQRTHAYVVRGKLLRDLYQRWCSWEPKWGEGHADHIMGPFLAGYKVYAPVRFFVSQGQGYSDITNNEQQLRSWNG